MLGKVLGVLSPVALMNKFHCSLHMPVLHRSEVLYPPFLGLILSDGKAAGRDFDCRQRLEAPLFPLRSAGQGPKALNNVFGRCL